MLLKCTVVFKKINNEFERFIKYIDSDGVMMRYGSNVDVINELHDSLGENYEKESNRLRGSNFIFSSVDLTYLEVTKINLKRVGTFVSTPEWIFNKKAIINPNNFDDEFCFAWSIIISIHYNEIGRDHNRISKLKRFINNYDWSDINFPTDKRDWNRFEKQNFSVALNIFSAHESVKKFDNIRISKFNRTRPHKVVLLMITDGEKRHFTSVRSETRLFRGVFSKHHNDYYCLNCTYSYRTENALKKQERLCLNNKDCLVKLPFKNQRILKYEKDMRSVKAPHMIYLDYECLLKNIKDRTNINEEESYQIKNNLHVPCGYGLLLVRSYDENFLTHYRGTDCMEKLLKAVCAMIGKTKEAPHKALSKEQIHDYNLEEECFVCKKEFVEEKKKTVEYCYFTGDYVGVRHTYCLSYLNKSCKRAVEIPIGLHNGSSYDCHFIIKELAKGVDGLICIGENSEKYITFKAIINTDLIEFKLKFIDTFGFIPFSLDSMVNNLTELNQCKECGKECNNYVRINNTIKYSCNKCKKVSYKPISDLIKRCSNVYSISNGDLDKLLLLLRKGVYPYEYMNSWNRFNECKNPSFEKYFSELNMSNISKEDYAHSQKIWSTFKIQDIGEYHDLYVKTDVLLLADVFENFRKMCHDIYRLDPVKYVSAPNLAWQVC